MGGGDDTVRSDRSSFQQRGAVRHRRAGPCGVRAAFTQQLGAGAPFLKTLKALAVESAYNWYWLVDGLMDAGVDVRLVNTAAVPQYAGLKHDNDHTDARHLAHLLRLNLLPEGYIYPREQRGVRDLLRRRFLLVRQSARLTNSLQCAWSRRSGYGIRTNVHTQVDPMERWVLESIRCTPEPQALRSVPGQSRSGVVKA
ncbi:MAG: transposase [Xanthomonadales bacterium]|nr:transposase [Xanthomonadales bacterium]